MKYNIKGHLFGYNFIDFNYKENEKLLEFTIYGNKSDIHNEYIIHLRSLITLDVSEYPLKNDKEYTELLDFNVKSIKFIKLIIEDKETGEELKDHNLIENVSITITDYLIEYLKDSLHIKYKLN